MFYGRNTCGTTLNRLYSGKQTENDDDDGNDDGGGDDNDDDSVGG